MIIVDADVVLDSSSHSSAATSIARCQPAAHGTERVRRHGRRGRDLGRVVLTSMDLCEHWRVRATIMKQRHWKGP